MRKLATIQRIKELTPIPNADTLEVATILGWKCVVKKDQFTVGDLCVYIEIDSILPDKPEFEFMKKTKMRVRTVRLRGQISQGLCLALGDIPHIGESEPFDEGEDVTERMGITQYIPVIPTCLTGQVKGSFPSFIPKTDETRVQLLQDVLTRYKGTPCYITEKLDGSSVTYFLKDGVFGVCSRNLELYETESNAFWQLAREMKIEERLRSLGGRNIAIQGELFGNGLQGNPLKMEKKEVRFFSVFDIDQYKYYNYKEMTLLLETLGLPMVPLFASYYILQDDIDHLVELSKGPSFLNPKVQAEGIVIRPLEEKVDLQMAQGLQNGRVSFKVINPEYLLAFDE